MNIKKYLPSYQGATIFSRYFWRNVRWKLTKGYTPREIYSLDWTLIKFIKPRLGAFLEEIRTKRINCPQEFLDIEYTESLKQGYMWNARWARIDDKEENRRCHNRAIDAWIAVLQQILDGIDDIILEDENYSVWAKKWWPIALNYQKRINEAKTEKKKKEIWNEIGSWESYEKAKKYGLTVTRDHCAYGYRQRAKQLFFKHFEQLWI